MASEMPPRYVAIWGVDSPVGEAVVRLAERDYGGVLAIDSEGGWVVRSGEPERGNAVISGAVPSGDSAAAGGTPLTAAAWIAQSWGSLDALIDCSTGMELWPKSEDSPERLLQVLKTNVLDPWRHTDELVELLELGSESAVVYLSSIDGLLGNPSLPAYSAGQAGTASLARTMAARLGSRGIRVNAVAAAGVIQTPYRSGLLQRAVGDRELASKLTPLSDMPTPEHIAEVMLFLASVRAGGVSGAVIPVDGGRTAVTPGTWSGPGL